MKLILLLLLSVCFYSIKSNAQTAIPKKIIAKRTASSLQIDGNLDDAAWKDAPVATDFIEFRPSPGRKENPSNKTDIYILYDNTSIYVGGFCHEISADSISKELIGRDNIGANDFVGVIFDTYHDKINGVGFTSLLTVNSMMLNTCLVIMMKMIAGMLYGTVRPGY